MQTKEDGIIANDLDTEVWFRLECSLKDADDWCTVEQRTYDTMIAAKCALDRRAMYQYEGEFDWRLVRVTTKTESVEYAK